MSHVLISSAGRRGELVRIFQESQRLLGGGGQVFTVDRSPLTAAGWLSAALDLVPTIGDPGFIEAVFEVCRRREVRHIVPTLDPELPPYAAAREQFAEIGVEVWVSDPGAIEIVQSKRSTNAWLRSNGLPAVRQLDLRVAASDPDLAFPVIAKPAGGSSSIGLLRVSSREELLMLDASLDYVVEEIAPGVEYTVDVLVDFDSVVMAAVPRRRLETRAGEVSKGVTVSVPEVERVARRVVAALPGPRGVLNVQVFHDPVSGAVHVIEINARFGGGFPLAWAAGAQFPLWLMEQSAGREPTASLAWRAGTVMLRYDTAVVMQVDPGEFL